MICKDDLVTWFKNLESYKRIDVMCTLLNLCLPFELRFLGTCLEELGRRDAQDLRGVELRVNNPQEFVTDVGSFQSGQPTDMKIRRKMALYLALMRACNRTGVNELFKTLDRWGDRDFTKFSDGDPLQELLLVYTMATNHPVFSFEQRLKCGEIYSKITSSKAHLNQQQSSTSTSPVTSPVSSFSVQHQTASPPPFQSGTFQQQPNPQQMMNPTTQQQIPNPILMPMAFPQAALISSGDPSTSTIALSVESLPSHLVAAPNMVIPPDFTTPPPHWQMRFQPQMYPTIVPIETQQQYPPQTSSPHISQPSSPTHSRTGSPARSQQSQTVTQNQQLPPRRGMRTRPTTETTPPPLQQQTTNAQQSSQQQTQGSGTINFNMGNDITMVQTIKNFDELNMDGAISQLHSLTIRNGYNRPSNTLPRQSNKPNWTTLQWQMQQQQQQQQQQIQSPQTHISYVPMHLDPIQLIQQQHHHKSTTGSESGSSTGGDLSPPPQSNNSTDPNIVLHGNTNQSQSSGLRNKALNLNRLNGSGNQSPQQQQQQQQMHQTNNLDFNGTQNNPVPNTLVSSSSSGNLLLIGGQMHNFPTYRNLPGTATIQRQFPPQINGELTAIYPFNTPGTTFIQAPTQVVTSQPQQNRVSPSQTPPVLLPTPYPTNKLVQSCFNCGSINHTGLNCSEASMEDVTRNAIYKLDYTVSSAQTQFLSTPVLTATSSSGNLNQLQGINQSASSINNNLEPEPIFIDLTQDTSSDSSISNR
ncbi:hypothetical protein ACKWTF_000812 [Chironomus riparius]